MRFDPNLIWEFFQPASEKDRLAPTDFRFWAKLVRPPTSDNSTSYSFKILLPDLDAEGGDGKIEASLYGISDLEGPADHNARLLFNKREIARATWDGLRPATLQGVVPAAAMVRGENLIEAQLTEPSEGPTTAFDVVMLDWVKVTYPRRPHARKNYVVFSDSSPGPRAVAIDGFTTDALRALDVTHGRLLDVEVKRSGLLGRDRTATVRYDGPTSTVVVFSGSTPLPTPQYLEGVTLVGFRQVQAPADFLVVTPRELLPAIAPLVEYRRAEGLRVTLAPAEDIYEEFGGGFPGPQPIKDLVAFARRHWGSPKYLLLVGDACAVSVMKTWLPTFSYSSMGGSHASDQWFATFEDEGTTPALAVGRISGRTPEQVATVVEKTIAREQALKGGPWRAESLFITASTDWAERDARNIIRNRLFPLMDTKVLRTNTKAASIEDHRRLTKDIAAALNDGRFFTVFIGHGGGAVWEVGPSIREEFYRVHLFDNKNIEALANADQQTILLALTCFTNDFDHAHFPETIGESFLRAKGGAVAVIATSGRTDDNDGLRFAREFFRQIMVDRVERVGEAVRRALCAVNNPEMNRLMVLLGDPAAKVMLPEPLLPPASVPSAPATAGPFSVTPDKDGYRIAGRLANSTWTGKGVLRISDATGQLVRKEDIDIHAGAFDAGFAKPPNADKLIWPLGASVYAFDPASHRDWLGAVKIERNIQSPTMNKK